MLGLNRASLMCRVVHRPMGSFGWVLSRNLPLAEAGQGPKLSYTITVEPHLYLECKHLRYLLDC